jgi:hypothetical protein
LAKILALLILLAGLWALYVSHFLDGKQGLEDARALLHELGALLVVTVVVSWLWEYKAKREFLDEVLHRAGVAKELTSRSLRTSTTSRQTGISFSSGPAI